MATIQQNRVISTPGIYISDVLISISPNSGSMKWGGETDVRTVSAGGGAVDIVYSVNAERMLAEVKFELPVTAGNVKAVRQWKANANNGMSETVRVVDIADQFAFDQMFLANEPEMRLSADGKMSCEFKGRYVE